ncbi:RnfABCDGE type electron transport complex subunit D [Acholeplasma sp. OttesenSCG-928-E16]|nr:RnfABCDGE type electron transport complex subunit D [Acholeplasma sp. OttesenSCG-928-E16]
MEVVKKTSPYIRKKETSTTRMMIDVLISLLPVVAFSVYRFGTDALIRVIVSITVMIALEVLMIGFIKTPKEAASNKALEGNLWTRFLARYKHLRANNFIAPAVSGVIYAMLLPSTLSIYVLIVGAIFAILVGKMVFGGFGQNIFNPAGLGRIFVGAFFGAALTYTQTNDVIAGATPLGPLKDMLTVGSANGGVQQLLTYYSFNDLFLGNIPGSMGEISKLAIIIGGIYLVVRKAADFRVMLSTIGAFAIMILFAGMALNPANPFEFLLAHLLTGGIIFGAVYMVTDPVTSPVTKPGRVLYGVIIGILAALIRIFGSMPEGMAFAIMIVNMFVPLIDYYKWAKPKYTWQFAVVLGALILVCIPVFYFAAGGNIK